MNEKHKERLQMWADALRSGEYEQGRRVMRARDVGSDEYRYCCLGVASDLYRKNVGGSWDEEGEEQVVGGEPTGVIISGFTDAEGYEQFAYLTPNVREWFGFSMQNPKLSHTAYGKLPTSYPTAAAMNDTMKMGFDEIASAIEKLIKGG